MSFPSTTSTVATITDCASNDVWHQHESEIRELYQIKKKTLKQAKEEMEKKGFPKKPYDPNSSLSLSCNKHLLHLSIR
jgi:hypothetical protein